MWIQTRPISPARQLSGLLTRRQMQQVLHRERARADRSGGLFSMVQFQFRFPRALAGKGSDRRMMRLARSVARRARVTDDVGWFGQDVLCAVLHNCPAHGARRFASDIHQIISDQLAPQFLCRIYTYPNGSDDGGEELRIPPPRRHDDDKEDGESRDRNGGSGSHRPQLARRQTTSASAEMLVPFVMQGFVSEMTAAPHEAAHETRQASPQEPPQEAPPADIGLEVGQVQALLVRPMPMWKRALDVIVTTISLAVLWPIMLVIGAAVRLTSPGPAIFRQRRTGLGGKPFTLYKFRTMVADAEARKTELRKFSEQDGPAFKMTHDPRVTPLGRFLRSTSLDELPQLWNVLKGDMSLVGPRPLPVAEAEACEQWHRQRVDITPGITCIWQVKGRSTVSFAEWVRMDLSYLRQRGPIKDLAILLQTIPAVLKRRGAR